MALLDIDSLSVRFGAFQAVDALSLQLQPGELLGVVGESGSGKSVSMMALMGLIAAPGVVTAQRLQFMGADLLQASGRERRKLIGRDMAMVFQDALSSLNPSYPVGWQIEELLDTHLGLRGAAARQRVIELLEQVEIPDARKRAKAYPHELSGGMNQRVMIAMAIACGPKLLIADEPTTALDVTIQAQVIALLQRLQREQGMALLMITHDLGVIAELAEDGGRVAVMYAGQLVETGTATQVFEQPRHPYTAALLAALPEHNRAQGGERARLQALPGLVPGVHDRPAGCLFAPRCAQVQPRCQAERPPLEQGVRCFFPKS